MFLQGSTPNSDWGAARGAGKTNNPSLYNVKYRANQISLSRPNGRTVFIDTRNAAPRPSRWSQPALTADDRQIVEEAQNRKDRMASPLRSDGGARRDRTDDLLNANQALSQLSYGPISGIATPLSRAKSEPAIIRRPVGGAAKGVGAVLAPSCPQRCAPRDKTKPFAKANGGHGWTRTTDLTLIRRVL